jgi:hypothetical protein
VLRDAPLRYVGALVDALATTTMDFMIRNPAEADEFSESGFEAVWRLLTCRRPRESGSCVDRHGRPDPGAADSLIPSHSLRGGEPNPS